MTLRGWANSGRIRCVWVGSERRFDSADLDAFVAGDGIDPPARVEALYVRVSGSSGQETSLVGQEAELRSSATGQVAAVFKDRASGLNENRPGLKRLLTAADRGEFNVVRVTHEDRLARFGTAWLRQLLTERGVVVEVEHTKGSAGGMDELLADFMSLVATFAGRMYGIRSREAKARLLKQASAGVAAAAGRK